MRRLFSFLLVLALAGPLFVAPAAGFAAGTQEVYVDYFILKLPWGEQKIDDWTPYQPAWSAPDIAHYGDFVSVSGDLSEVTGNLGTRETRIAFVTRWNAVFKNIVSGKQETFDNYDVYQLLEWDIALPEISEKVVGEQFLQDGTHIIEKALVLDMSNPIFDGFRFEDFTDRRGLGLIGVEENPIKVKTIVEKANGSWAFVRDYIKQKLIEEADKRYFITNYQEKVLSALRTRDIVLLSGGKVESTVASWTGDPAAPGNGTATFLITPWPFIDRAEADGGRAIVQFRAWGFSNELATLHPRVWLTTTPDDPEAGKIAEHDYGDQPGPEFKGTFQADLPKDVDLSTVWAVVEDGFGRTAKKPLKEKPELWVYSWLADDEFEYVKGQNWFFRSDLMLLYKDGPLFDVKSPEKYANDRFIYEYSVDGGAWQTLLVADDLTRTFAGGRPRTSAIIGREALNTQIAKNLQDGRDHEIRFKVKAAPGNFGVYKFVSAKNPTPAAEAVVTIKVHARQAIVQKERGLWRLRWSTKETPNEVQSGATFEAPLWISNDGDAGNTTNVTVKFTGNAIIKRVYKCPPQATPGCTPPPPDYMNFPLEAYVERPVTLGAHDAEEWRVAGSGTKEDPQVRYIIRGYFGPTSSETHDDYLLIPILSLEEAVGNNPQYGPLTAGNAIAKIKGYDAQGRPVWGFFTNNVRIEANADKPSLFYPANLPQVIYVNVIGPDGGYVVPRPKVRLIE